MRAKRREKRKEKEKSVAGIDCSPFFVLPQGKKYPARPELLPDYKHPRHSSTQNTMFSNYKRGRKGTFRGFSEAQATSKDRPRKRKHPSIKCFFFRSFAFAFHFFSSFQGFLSVKKRHRYLAKRRKSTHHARLKNRKGRKGEERKEKQSFLLFFFLLFVETGK